MAGAKVLKANALETFILWWCSGLRTITRAALLSVNIFIGFCSASAVAKYNAIYSASIVDDATTRLRVYPSDRRTEPLAAPLTGRRPEDATPWEPDLPHYCSLGPGNPSPLGRTIVIVTDVSRLERRGCRTLGYSPLYYDGAKEKRYAPVGEPLDKRERKSQWGPNQSGNHRRSSLSDLTIITSATAFSVTPSLTLDQAPTLSIRRCCAPSGALWPSLRLLLDYLPLPLLTAFRPQLWGRPGMPGSLPIHPGFSDAIVGILRCRLFTSSFPGLLSMTYSVTVYHVTSTPTSLVLLSYTSLQPT
ncbi:hypothetical protein BC829DRAFT_422293 [Chytridium lagenaria]|nr:hypothetical protein BC829DRAFT_422293 [Chytridium lagenaria]